MTIVQHTHERDFAEPDDYKPQTKLFLACCCEDLTNLLVRAQTPYFYSENCKHIYEAWQDASSRSRPLGYKIAYTTECPVYFTTHREGHLTR